MTDNEIVKALECCCGIEHDCDKCPYEENDECGELNSILKDALDLINRLQAENERLNFVRTRDAQRYDQKISDQAHTNCILIDLHSKAIKEVKELEEKLKTAKAEAYKEFAEIMTERFIGIPLVVHRIGNILKELERNTK